MISFMNHQKAEEHEWSCSPRMPPYRDRLDSMDFSQDYKDQENTKTGYYNQNISLESND